MRKFDVAATKLLAYCFLIVSVAGLYVHPERWLLVPCAVAWFGVWAGCSDD